MSRGYRPSKDYSPRGKRPPAPRRGRPDARGRAGRAADGADAGRADGGRDAGGERRAAAGKGAERARPERGGARSAHDPAMRRGRAAAEPRASAAPRRAERPDEVLARIEATAVTAADVTGVSFADLGLDPRIVDALARLGADEPFPIQVATIPDVIGGRHVLGRGRTGSGKSIAFGAGLVQRLLALGGAEGGAGRPPRALVLANTRELALQLDRTIRPLAQAVGLYTAQLYGGVPVRNQIAGLERGVDIVIGTPGRVLDLAKRGELRLERIAVTVLDEADEMCDLGFLDQIEAILKLAPRKSQRMLFSATLDAAVLGLVERWLRDPAVHEVAGEAARGGIDHRVLVVERADKEAVVAQLAGSGGRVLVFVRTKAGADTWAAVLADHGVRAVVLHGDLSQARRQRNLADLTRGKVDVLVATDVAARGIHIDDVRLVVQADPPDEYKTYLHRAGRTGRAGATGTVVTVIAPSRRRRMQELLERAEIDASLVPASPGGRELDEFQQHR